MRKNTHTFLITGKHIGDLPERLFTHSLELIGDEEGAEPSTLFLEIQMAAELLADIRNALAARHRPTHPEVPQ